MDMQTVFYDSTDASNYSSTYGPAGAVAYLRPSATGDFSMTLQTTAHGFENDWDGARIQLRAGETITITHDDPASGPNHNYYIALDTDGDPTTGTNSVPYDGILAWLNPIGWEFENFTTDGPITYLMPEDGFVYVGTGFSESGSDFSEAGDYITTIEVNDDHIVYGASGSDNLVSGSDADYLNGLAGDDILTGNGGNDVLVGAAGSDQYIYTDASSDGHDRIMGFDSSSLVGADNDVINLDALFDALDIANSVPLDTGARDFNAVYDATYDQTEITALYDGAPVPDFSITLDGIDIDVATLNFNSNIELS
jgi:Ca2+-binding RTX toxin-like protein